MNKLFRRSIVALVLAALLLGGVGFFLFEYALQGRTWATQTRNPHLYTNGILDDLRITDRNGELLFSSQGGTAVWHEDAAVRRAVVHAIGDLQGNIGSGVIHQYREKWIDFGYFGGVYRYINGGRTLLLNLDAQLCATAAKALGRYDGVVGVLNYKTGEIYTMVSASNFDPTAVPETSGEGMYLNRFLSATYTPGSVYKIVTLQAAIENLPNWQEMTFTCKGKCEIGGEVITCSGVHGKQDLKQAFANSCNCAFGELAVAVGKERLIATAERVGLTGAATVDWQQTAAGAIKIEDGADAQLAWSGIGQHLDTVNPAAFLRYVGAIANSGVAEPMRLCGSSMRGNGSLVTEKTGSPQQLMDAQTAQLLSEFMQNNVDTQYGSWRFGGLAVGAKSGTAQQDAEAAHSVFTGFVADDNFPFAFFVLAEHAGAGQGVAMQTAGAVVNKMK